QAHAGSSPAPGISGSSRGSQCSSSRRVAMRPLLPLLIAAAACSTSSAGNSAASGTIEVVETDIAPMQAARVVRVRAEEGDAVRAGDTLAVLTQATSQSDVAERAAQ